MPETVTEVRDMHTVHKLDSDGIQSNDEIMFVTNNRKMANEVVDELNKLEPDHRGIIHTNEIEDEWTREFISRMGYRNIEVQFGSVFFSYENTKFVNRYEEETEEEREERERLSEEFSEAIDEKLEEDGDV